MIETKNFGYYVYRVIGYIILAFIVVVSIFPFIWFIMSSFKSNGAILSSPFSLPDTFNFNAYHYSTDNLTKAVYTYQLQKQDGITLNLDYNTTGVGCTACYVLPGYQVKPARYERHLTIKPISH